MATIEDLERPSGYSRGVKRLSRLGWFVSPAVAVGILVFVFLYTLPAGWKAAAGMTGGMACVIVGAYVTKAIIRRLGGVLAEVKRTEQDKR